ncbi:MAG TPA: NAD-dependent dehydratase [Phycisphaerales bacterium]|nr:NAD-dependent dehydratase [Phycisphaerales bacterium]|tara:strand:+ start:1077 stop:2072 length:996 start_codon:yes stop_codon:yes gene_type:complete
MRALFIGGTGNISTASSRLAIEHGWELYLLNRGTRAVEIPGAKSIIADINEPQQVREAIGDLHFDVIVNWIAFNVDDVQRDLELFADSTDQYIFISSASVYQKPSTCPVITESTPLANPYWEYSRNKIACEDLLMQTYRAKQFPITIVRPSLTYDTVIPVLGSWSDYTIIDRIKRGKSVVVHGDGTSLWTITHALDFAKGIVGLMANPNTIGHAFHITSDEVLTWNQIYKAVADAAGLKVNMLHVASDFIADVADDIGMTNVRGSLLGDKSHSVIFDNTKIKTYVPDFKATIRFDQGIRRTLQWFDADPSRKKIVDQNNVLLDTVIERYQR